jgi:plasmid maintenance system killer protein
MSNFESNENNGKGFAGLDSLVSDVSTDVVKTVMPEVRNVSASLPVEQTADGPRASPHQPRNETKASLAPMGWIIGGILIVIILIANSGSKVPPSVGDSEPSLHASPPLAATLTPSPDPAAAPSEDALKADLETPPVGQNMLFNVRQIRYCRIEHIRITAFERVISNTDRHEIDRFNEIVNDYNSRCGAFRYRGGDLQLVQREMEARNDSISSAAKSEWVRSSLGLLESAQSVSSNPDVASQSAPRLEYPTSQPTEPVSKESLSLEEKESIESACSAQKTLDGPAKYNKCLKSKLSALQSGPRNIDLSGLNSEEKESIESACSAQKTLDGPAQYNKCLSTKLSLLKSAARNIDLSSLSYSERESIQSACSAQKTLDGPAQYNKCLSAKLSSLRAGPRNIDLSGLSYSERESIESACSAQKTLDGPAEYNKCLTRKLR